MKKDWRTCGVKRRGGREKCCNSWGRRGEAFSRPLRGRGKGSHKIIGGGGGGGVAAS